MSTPVQPKLFADPIGRVFCILKNVEIGLLYRWNNGELQLVENEQAALTEPQIHGASGTCK